MVGQLETIADEIIFTTFAFDRAISAGELASYAKESKLVLKIGKRQLIRRLK